MNAAPTRVRKPGHEPPGRRKKAAARREDRHAPAPPPPTDGLRAWHKHDKRERIRAAAWELFTTLGYEATTTRAIAERAGVAAGTVFLYAKDKADLLFLIFEGRISELVNDAFRTLPRRVSLQGQLLHIFGKAFAMYGVNKEVGARFVKELPGADGPNAQRVNALTLTFLQQLASLVEAAQARGEVRPDVIPLQAAQVFWSLYFMALLSWLAGFTTLETSLDPMLKDTLALVSKGLEGRA